MGILISTLRVQELVGLYHIPSMVVPGTAHDWFRLNLFISAPCYATTNAGIHLIGFLWVFFPVFKLLNVKTTKCLLKENPVLVEELYSALPSHKIHLFLQS